MDRGSGEVLSRSDRLGFMKSAETMWLVVDGRVLRELSTRQGAITRLGELLGRLEAMTRECPPRVLVVVTHRDKGELEQSIRDRLKAEIAKRVSLADVVEVAPVADDETIPGSRASASRATRRVRRRGARGCQVLGVDDARSGLAGLPWL